MADLALFRSPYSTWRPDQLLRYYQTRTQVHYFPIRDAEQASPALIAGILENRFTFNGETHTMPNPMDWMHNPSRDQEWLILLHKFYYAAGLGDGYAKTQERRPVDQWIALTESWIDTVPLDFLSSDVMARRVQNWIFGHHYFITQAQSPHVSPEFYLKFIRSLHSQVNYLCEHLTPARNHRTIELTAIFLAAVVFPELQAADEWLALARRELVKNLQADLLADGVHCELSTDYHHLVLRNYLNVRKLATANQVAWPAELDCLLRKALEFAKYIHKPDGRAPALSDGDVQSFLAVLKEGYLAFGDEELLYVATQGEQGRPPSVCSRLFPASGYAVLRSGWGDSDEPFADERYLVFDCGPLGAGNHGHLDLLNIEAAAYGQSLIVDPGRYTYFEPHPTLGEPNWRARFRGTEAHNTVLVDGKNQTRYEFQKSRFRITGPAPDHELAAFVSGSLYDFLHGIVKSHEYPVVHERKILFVRPEYWVISDLLYPIDDFASNTANTIVAGEALDIHTYDLRFQLSAGAYGKVTTQKVGDTHLVNAPHLVMAQPWSPTMDVMVEDSFVSPTYGVKHPAPRVRYVRQGAVVLFHTIVYPYRAVRPDVQVRSLPVRCDGRLCAPDEASALEITIRQAGCIFIDLYFTAGPQGQPPYTFAPDNVTTVVCNDALYLSRRRQEDSSQAAPFLVRHPGITSATRTAP